MYPVNSSTLTTIVTQLLNNSDEMGELCDAESYRSFAQDIAGVVADHCGGSIRRASLTQSRDLSIEVLSDENLPDLEDNVWTRPITKAELYNTLVLNCVHLTPEMFVALQEEGENPSNNMVFGRDTGVLIKLYKGDDVDPLGPAADRFPCAGFRSLIAWANRQNVEMVEFDCDAQVYPGLPIFDH